jgi:thiol-disulfide isomerase/thioredoxin
MKRKHFLLVGLLVLGLGTGAGYLSRSPNQEHPVDSPTRLLFEQTFKDANDQVVDLAQYRDHVLIVNFWATWCAPCIQEMPELSAMQNEFANQPVQFVGLAIDDKDKVRQFEKRLSVDYPLPVLGASGIELAREFGNKVGALPFTFVLNRKSEVVDRTVGIVQMDHLRGVIKQALGN